MYQQYPRPEPGLVKELTERQNQLREQVISEPFTRTIKYIAGCDSSFIGEQILSVFVVLKYPELEVVEKVWHVSDVTLPYVPGFLAFRESPNLMMTYEKLQHTPDIIMVDGHGIAHPRRMGIACHLGVMIDVPTIGVAKKVLTGKFQEPDMLKGSISPLIAQNEHIANVIRTKDNVKPVFVSPGHRCDIDTATRLVLETARKHKLPEPTRLADYWAEVFKKDAPSSDLS